jgi:predicted nucleotidyltransferase
MSAMNQTKANANPNIAILEVVAAALGSLKNEVVFVGGCAAGLLLTEVRAESIRPTEDVDLVVSALTTQDYYAFEQRLRAQGFTNDLRANAPICRWVYGLVCIDVMPTNNAVLGFGNVWYPYAYQTATQFNLPSGESIKLIRAPSFIATKFEAFLSRGRDVNGRLDYIGSHDLEDIISVVDRRPELLGECIAESELLRQYLARQVLALLQSDDFRTTLPGHLPGDLASQGRLSALEHKLKEVAKLGSTTLSA